MMVTIITHRDKEGNVKIESVSFPDDTNATTKGLLQVSISRTDGTCVTDPDEMKRALSGSAYELDEVQTGLNDGIAMITTPTEEEAESLMDLGELALPSGYTVEIP